MLKQLRSYSVPLSDHVVHHVYVPLLVYSLTHWTFWLFLPLATMQLCTLVFKLVYEHVCLLNNFKLHLLFISFYLSVYVCVCVSVFV